MKTQLLPNLTEPSCSSLQNKLIQAEPDFKPIMKIVPYNVFFELTKFHNFWSTRTFKFGLNSNQGLRCKFQKLAGLCENSLSQFSLFFLGSPPALMHDATSPIPRHLADHLPTG